MKAFVSFATCCSAIFACASDPPADEPPASGGETQQAIEPDTQQDEVTESIECPPAAGGDATTACIQQFEEGDDTHWYTPIWPFPWPWHHGHKHGGPGDKPDRKECSPAMGVQGCLDCCWYNMDKVDGWDCRKLKPGTPAAARCWRKAQKRLSDCQVHTCNRHEPDPLPPVITTARP